MTAISDRPIVVGFDNSTESIAALRWAETYARTTGGMLRIVTVWEWPVAYGYPVVPPGYDPESDGRELVDKAVADLTLPRERIQPVVVEGNPARELVAQSAEAEVLVVGCHGHSAIGGFLLGSVTNYCLHHAACPVVVVR